MYPNRECAHDVNIVGSWMPDDAEADRHRAWVRDTFVAMEPFSHGVYVNFTSDDTTDRIRTSAYSPEQWRRLVRAQG